ncbi:MAG: cytochrome c3 family protein [Bacteroidetes bacterium]|nr:cytochrome c3 family protein [Bacteroidota bacterium]
MKRTFIFCALLFVISAGIALLLSVPEPVAADNGVLFSHTLHNDLADCATCHEARGSEDATDNLLPAPTVCLDCHDTEDVQVYYSLDESASLDTYVLPISDRRLYFSHKLHADGLEMECVQCHIGITDEVATTMPSMQMCYHCHNNADESAPIQKIAGVDAPVISATNQCEACHTTLAGLHPENHRVANFIQNHGKFAMNGEADRDCAVCHSQSFCQECHTPSNDVPAGVTSDRFYIDAYPRGEKIDDAHQLTVQKAHPLGYLYTHGFDARAKSTRCETCHEQESFCTPCHQNGYDASGVRIVPQSHQLAGFATVGGGAAMNRHGRLARMDMESCVTCHNVEGGDPVCAACHSTGAVTGGMR